MPSKMACDPAGDSGVPDTGCLARGPASEPRAPIRQFQTPPNLVVGHWTLDVEGSSPVDFLVLHAMWTRFGRLMSYNIMSIISVACDFTTKSGGMWGFEVTPSISLLS